jgi:alkanesulfonate monooxygenase SsuD/methylene tetrahydromethanopterin reductase-like flavin-dependent oxidoreductase (luciferase family)
VLLGLGTGHTPQEWHDIGRERPSPADRARRLVDSVEVVSRLLHGETVTVTGRHVSANGAGLSGLPVGAGRVALVVGGGHPDVLAVAAARADVVALSGLGRTLPDGHHHEVRWSEQHLRTQPQLIRASAPRRTCSSARPRRWPPRSTARPTGTASPATSSANRRSTKWGRPSPSSATEQNRHSNRRSTAVLTRPVAGTGSVVAVSHGQVPDPRAHRPADGAAEQVALLEMDPAEAAGQAGLVRGG